MEGTPKGKTGCLALPRRSSLASFAFKPASPGLGVHLAGLGLRCLTVLVKGTTVVIGVASPLFC